MTTNILMPSSMADGTLARWLRDVGDGVEVGDVIAEVETDKAMMQIEAPCKGVLVEIKVPEGSANLPADTLLAVLAD